MRRVDKRAIWAPHKDYGAFPLYQRGQFLPTNFRCQPDVAKACSGSWWAFCLGVSVRGILEGVGI